MKYYFVSFQLFIQKLSNWIFLDSGREHRCVDRYIDNLAENSTCALQRLYRLNEDIESRDFVKRWESSNIAWLFFTGTPL